ncbi:HNH endonuclease signature motif containing protein [Corynebacterium minutissimum]|uniref:HNH endonuclease signature motif containing protein n=1 Tax=Corynebacterium minutissimum TaxID=38301 RepID=UPI001EF171E7|nr:HNH endonuclease signature motif containing protein [Corynebacterium minutissimum]MCG7228518.1 HNH endonuclease [Corynebacterium minutissimum]MCG7237635.1 HNH endonuclease [Corynebacterium minutissimum]
MGDLETYFSYRNSGITLVEQAVGGEKRLRALGASPADATELARLNHIYFGATKFTGKQRTARSRAAEQHHDLATLSLIESYTKKLKNQLHAWNLRVKLAGTPASSIPAVAAKRLKELKPKRIPTPGVRMTYRADGPHSLTITDDPMTVTEMRGALESINKDNLLDASRHVFFNKSHGGTKPAVLTSVVVTLDKLDKIISGDGDDIVLELTNGGRMTGTQFLNYKFAEIGYVTLVHPTIGPVWLHRMKRLAGFEQRMMASAEHPTCARKGCNKPADYAHVHHLVPWKAGGATNPPNLTMLCAYHNGINDDDPDKPTGAGYVFRLRGEVDYIPPWGEPITAQAAYQQAQQATARGPDKPG